MIDLNAGYTMRNHPSTRIRVCMKKSQPGEFCTISGDPLPEEIAQQAGFDVAALKKESLKREKLEAARAHIEAEYANIEREIVAEDAAPAEPTEPASGYEMKHIGAGRYAVFTLDGERVTHEPLTKTQAEKALESIHQESHGKAS